MLAHVVDAGAFSIGLALYIGALMRNTKGIFYATCRQSV
jgi:hypothetical protein